MSREVDRPALDEAYLESRRAELASMQIPDPGPGATEQERLAWEAVQASVREVARAIAEMERTLRERRREESRQRQQRVQWEVVRLRLRRTVGRQPEARQQASRALVGRVLPLDTRLQTRVQEGEGAEQRRYLSGAIQTWRGALRYTPPEEALSEARALLEFLSLLPQPRPQDGAAEHLMHTRLQEEGRELHGMATGFEQQIAMRATAAAALAAPMVAPLDSDEVH